MLLWGTGFGGRSPNGFCWDIKIVTCLILLLMCLLPAELPYTKKFIWASITSPSLRGFIFFKSKVAIQAEHTYTLYPNS